MNGDRPRWIYAAPMVIVMFYAIHEAGNVLFAFHVSGTLVNLSVEVFMLALMWGLRSWWPFLYVLGSRMNILVMSANGGQTPVFGEEPVGRHVAGGPETHLAWFSDWIYFWGHASSIGDVLIVVGLCSTLWLLSRRVFAR